MASAAPNNDYAGGAQLLLSFRPSSPPPYHHTISHVTDESTDEINALVLDPGSHTTRAGFAGEDTPKSCVPTHYGFHSTSSREADSRVYGENAIHRPTANMEIRNPFNSDGLVEDWDTAEKLWQYSITSRLTVPSRSNWAGAAAAKRETPTPATTTTGGQDVNANTNANTTAVATDGEAMEIELEQLSSAQDRPLAEFPLLMSEPGWNPTKARERTMEIAMEEWGVPAFFLAKTGQLAA